VKHHVSEIVDMLHLVMRCIVLAVLLSPPAQATEDLADGRLCVGPVPEPNDGRLSLGNPSGGARSFAYSVQVDDGRIIELPLNQSVRYAGISRGKRHVIKIRNRDQVVESFQFSFEEYETDHLCLWFKALYQSWSLWRQRESGHLCQCN